jgi:NAD(P)-dependent dehydrogenase (short-subunit alcohol dehydrogenase family)
MASGIGEAIVRRLSAAGARVVIAEIDDEMAVDEAKEVGNRVFAIVEDITNSNSVSQP